MNNNEISQVIDILENVHTQEDVLKHSSLIYSSPVLDKKSVLENIVRFGDLDVIALKNEREKLDKLSMCITESDMVASKYMDKMSTLINNKIDMLESGKLDRHIAIIESFDSYMEEDITNAYYATTESIEVGSNQSVSYTIESLELNDKITGKGIITACENVFTSTALTESMISQFTNVLKNRIENTIRYQMNHDEYHDLPMLDVMESCKVYLKEEFSDNDSISDQIEKMFDEIEDDVEDEIKEFKKKILAYLQSELPDGFFDDEESDDSEKDDESEYKEDDEEVINESGCKKGKCRKDDDDDDDTDDDDDMDDDDDDDDDELHHDEDDDDDKDGNGEDDDEEEKEKELPPDSNYKYHDPLTVEEELSMNPFNSIYQMTPFPVGARTVTRTVNNCLNAETEEELIESLNEFGRLMTVCETLGEDILTEKTDTAIAKAKRSIKRGTDKVVQGAKTVGKKIHGSAVATKKIVDPMVRFIEKTYDDATQKDLDERKKIVMSQGIKGKVLKIGKWIRDVAIGAIATGTLASAGFSVATVISGIALLGYVARNAMLNNRARSAVIKELEDELAITREKIEDSRGDDNKQNKYQLMRIETKLQKELNRVKMHRQY